MANWNYYRFLAQYLTLVAFKHQTLGKTARRMAARYGDRPFLVFEGETLSFDQFNRLANRRANFFRQRGVGKGDVVCLLMENRPEYLTTLVGLGKLGAITAAINHNLRGQGLINSISISGGRHVIVGTECLAVFKEVLPRLTGIGAGETYLDTRWEGDAVELAGAHDLNVLLREASDAEPPPVKLNSKDLFMYIYTSGTTGMPKAARINHYRWYATGLAMGDYALHVRPNDLVYCPLPLYHSNGALIAFGSALVNGARLAISRRFSARRFWEDVNASGATCFIYIGELLRYLVNSPPSPYDRRHGVRRVLGNGLRPDIWEEFKRRFNIDHIREFYASTEGNAVTINMEDTVGSMGSIVLKSSNNLFVVRYDVEKDDYVRDERGFCTASAPGEAGELLGKIKATTPFYGYSNGNDTEKKVLRNVFEKGDAFFRTGDLVRKDARGNYYFVDRIGDTFRWKGENVSTHEVAEILSGVPGVSFANVYGVSIPGTEGRTGMAALTFQEGHSLDPEGFFRYAAEHLPPYAVPAFLRVIPEMDVTGTFKLKKTDLKQQAYNPDSISDPLYYRDGQARTYRPLDQAAFQKIQAGTILF